MSTRPINTRRPLLFRFNRSRFVRWVLALVMIPILLMGSFGGITLLAHAHDGHGSHFHASASAADARLLADRHRQAHASGVAACGSVHAGTAGAMSDSALSEPAQARHAVTSPNEPDGLLIAIPDHEQLASRGAGLSQVLTAAPLIQICAAWVCAQLHAAQATESPGGKARLRGGGPLHLAAATAGQRLVRTSTALLL